MNQQKSSDEVIAEQGLPLVVVSHRLPEEWLQKLEGKCQLIIGPDPEKVDNFDPELERHLEKAEGLFTLLTVRVDDCLLQKAPKLRVVSNMAVGLDNIDVVACTRRGIAVGHTPGVLTEGTADLTMALLLSVARRLPEASQDAKDGNWTTWLPAGWLGADLDGQMLGIVGMGKIGAAMAKRANGFGLRVVYTSPTPKVAIEREIGARQLPLNELLDTSDFVSLHVPLTAETAGLIGEEELRQMKRTAILINTARGPVVDPEALYRALSEGWIAAAGLDVTDPEPLPPDHPLYSLKNCLILPHIGSATQNTRRCMAELACDNLLAALEGRSMPHSVGFEVF